MKMQSLFAVSLVSLMTLFRAFAGGTEPKEISAALKPIPEMLRDAKRASELVRAGSYREAEQVYKDLSKRFPESAFAFYELGRCCFWQKKYKLAVEAFTRASALAPNEADPLALLGLVYQAQGHFDEAVVNYERALAITPGDESLKKRLTNATIERDLDASQKQRTTGSGQPDDTSPWNYRLAPGSGESRAAPEGFDYLYGLTLDRTSPNLLGTQVPSVARGEPLFVEDQRVWPVGDYLTPLEQSRLVIPPSNRVR